MVTFLTVPSLSLIHFKQYRVTHCYNFCVYVLAVKQCDTSVVFSSSFFVLNIFMFNTRVLYLSSLFSIRASYTCRLFSQNTSPMLVSLCSHHTCSILVVFVLNTRVQYLSVFVLNTRVLLYNCRLYSQYTCPILVVFVFVLSALQFGFCSGAGSVWSRHFLPEPPLQSL